MLSDEQALEIASRVKTVAVVGMTDGKKPGRPSFEIPKMLKERGIRVIPVNPNIETSLEEKVFVSISDVDEKVEVVDVFRRSEAIGTLADELIALPDDKKPEVIWIQTGIRNEEAEHRLERAGFKVVADKCLGVFVARAGR